MEKLKRTKVVDLLKSTAYGSIVNVKGWVRTHRSSKAVDFIALNDGSTIHTSLPRSPRVLASVPLVLW